ncbi:hypothetical protein MN116_004261 [Schistosoma mekongi]|uniref:Yippee domain-containing protein n=1 Tax=Schistosoma mekongi TaxID=38744 RepID=A0AAE1ZFU4_SCHME|nr:hypothetical protein MN116_004261 [Schistosoma mekongi]
MVKGKFQTYFPFEKNCLTYSCLHCRAHLARHDDLISKSFQGSQGRAYLFNQAVNIRCAEAKQRVLLTGLHFVADIFCACCDTALGWKYERAFEPSQRYKEGKVIIELVHLFKDNSWDAEWLYPLYLSSTTANDSSTTGRTLNYTKSHSVSACDYHHNETGKSKSSLCSPPIATSSSLSSTDGGVFESSTTNLIDPNEESCTDFVQHHYHHSHQLPHNHHHQHHYHLNTSSSSSSTQVHQSSFSLMSSDSTSLSYRLSSSLNATGWAFRIPPFVTSNNDSHVNKDAYVLDLSDSGRVSDYCHNSTSTSATENIGHSNLVCSTDNNDNNDSDVGNIDYVAPNNLNMDKNSARNNIDNKTRSTDNQTSTIVDNNAHKDDDEEHLVEISTKSKSPVPITIKLCPEGQKDNPTDNDNSGYSCLQTDAYDILENIDNMNNRRPMDDLCLRKLSQYSTPQTRRISKINSQNLRVTFNSNLGKLNRKRPKYRIRASSASPSRDLLLLTGSDNDDDEEEELTDNRSSDFIDYTHQTHNIVKVQD